MRVRLLATGVTILSLSASLPAQAGEQLLNLWPNQRASHAADMEGNAAEYHARGQAYVDKMYSSGGESTSAEPEDLHMGAFDGYPELTPIPINVGEVANIIKAGIVPELPEEEAVSPETASAEAPQQDQ